MRKLTYILLILLFSACAKIVTPTGGPKDETPPVMVSSIPENKSVNINSNSIRIEFDEYINPFTANDIIISPYQKEAPELQFVDKSVIIKFNEDLEPNTTYSIDFNQAIKDYRQGNVIETLDYAFSTGAVLDTAELSGSLIQAETGEPFLSETMRVLVYPPADSLVFKEAPRYLARLDSTGSFKVKNLVAGTYNVYALDDLNFNNYFDQIGEAVGFLDESVNTSDSSSQELNLFVHLSEDTIIRIDNTNKLEDGQGTVILSKKFQEIEIEDQAELYIEQSEKSDSLSIWYTNEQTGTRAILGNGTVIDSLSFKEYEDSLRTHQNFKFSSSQLKTAEEPVRLKFKHPFEITDPSLLELYQDSVLIQNMATDTPIYSIEVRKRALEIEIEPSDTSRYYLVVYPGGLENIFAYSNTDTLTHRFKKSTFDTRGTLTIEFLPLANEQYFMELLDKGNVMMTYPIERGKNTFEKVQRGTYQARLIRDDNGNGIWDTGNIYEKKQPEKIIILDTPLKVQPGWENEFIIDLQGLL